MIDSAIAGRKTEGEHDQKMKHFIFACGTIADSILITWVYNHTRGSVLLAFLFHNALNITALYLPLSLSDNWQGVVAQCLVALIVVIATGPARLSRQPSGGLMQDPLILRERNLKEKRG
ncbi:hypothetical protein [Tengunoibacter tsumagoiensis]|uniref:hypothetical protein n=1 Tax=Tengunoibacter tsumagoiensis TaxID=2014871 RepID=UPI000F83EA1D|nr:hypothetical protein [Tengunoibacter tsumagoiensis]